MRNAVVRGLYWVAYLIGIGLAAGVVVQAVDAAQLAEASPGSPDATFASVAAGTNTALVVVYGLCVGALRISFRRRRKAIPRDTIHRI